MRYIVRFPGGDFTEADALDANHAARLACAARWPTHSYFSADSIDCEVNEIGSGSAEWVPYEVIFEVSARAVRR